MPREYRHIKPYENEIMEMKREGLTQRQIAERLGMRYEQIRGFFKRKNKRDRMIEAGEVIKKVGRPRRIEGMGIPPSVQKQGELVQMRYVIASKERYIKRLEMENELMKDFLSHIERK